MADASRVHRFLAQRSGRNRSYFSLYRQINRPRDIIVSRPTGTCVDTSDGEIIRQLATGNYIDNAWRIPVFFRRINGPNSEVQTENSDYSAEHLRVANHNSWRQISTVGQNFDRN